jgi:hypothetical protein
VKTPGTQPTAEDVANVRELVRDLGQRGSENLPAGHPPVAGMGEKPVLPELPVASKPAVKLTYTPPETWQKEPVKGPLRYEQYRLPRAPGDTEDAELVVSTGIGGGLALNLARWRGQFSLPNGQPVPDEGVVQQTLEANGLRITVVDIAGRYNAGAMMTGMPSTPKDNYRMLGAIVETAGGLWYFKALGPAETIGVHRDEFLAFLHTIEAEPPTTP